MWCFRGLVFTNFIRRTESSTTVVRSAGKVSTSTSRCKNQCVTITYGCLSFILLTKPLVSLTMATAPSVQISTVLYQYWCDPKNHVVFSGNALQSRKFSLMASPSTKRTLIRSGACLWTHQVAIQIYHWCVSFPKQCFRCLQTCHQYEWQLCYLTDNWTISHGTLVCHETVSEITGLESYISTCVNINQVFNLI